MAKRMRDNVARKAETNTISVQIDMNAVAKGHPPTRSGAGRHDNRPKRHRTRNAQFRQSMKDW